MERAGNADLIGLVSFLSGPAALKANNISLLTKVMELLGAIQDQEKARTHHSHNNGISLILVTSEIEPHLFWKSELMQSSYITPGKQTKKRKR